MIDSVLKGTGNSRFLKSAVPAGTSWADALAMLQAGTFPIDFNGINTEGFQQVGTPLNKANLLKDATAAQIGLPPSATPNDMFNVLAHAGDLHVWKKTVVNASEKPAGYTLGAETTKTLGLTRNRDSSSWAITVELASSVSVDDAGNVTLVSPTKRSIYANNEFSDLFSGKFFRMYSIGSYVTESELYNNEVYFVPPGNKLILRADTSGSKFYLDLGMKLVTGYAKIPAGTTTTYPVSTNRNAYQEGNDAKPAGYTLGEVVTGTFQPLSYGSSIIVYYASSVTVSDSGVLRDIPSTNSASIRLNDTPPSELKGKFIQIYSGDRENTNPPFNDGKIYYIPSNAVFATNTIDRYQPVAGYAAIPANTTIEYLGCLGDKAMVQVVSYVGTGTYGSSNPNSLTFDFVPKIVVIQSPNESTNIEACIALNGSTLVVTYPANGYVSTFSWNKKTVSWYNQSGYQLNNSGEKYYAVAIG